MQLVDWIREDKPTPVTAEHARHVVDIIESAYRSAATGQAQDLRTTFVPVGVISEQAMLPSAEPCRAGGYPLTRPVIVCIDPFTLSPEARAFLRYVVSPEGQDLVAASFLYEYAAEPDLPPDEAKRRACRRWFCGPCVIVRTRVFHLRNFSSTRRWPCATA